MDITGHITLEQIKDIQRHLITAVAKAKDDLKGLSHNQLHITAIDIQILSHAKDVMGDRGERRVVDDTALLGVGLQIEGTDGSKLVF